MQIKVTGDVNDYLKAIIEEGAVAWNTPNDGITVPPDVQASLELLHGILAGATPTVDRDQQTGRVTSIAIANPNPTTYDNLTEAMTDAIDSHDDIGEGDDYFP